MTSCNSSQSLTSLQNLNVLDPWCPREMTAEGFTERRELSLGEMELGANIHPLSVLGNNWQFPLLSADVLETSGNL